MSVVSDLQGVVQALVTPDLKALQADLKSLSDRVGKIEERLGKNEERAQARSDKFEDSIRGQLARAEDDSRRRHEEMMFMLRLTLENSALKQKVEQMERQLPASGQ
jgi:hypothetical protein